MEETKRSEAAAIATRTQREHSPEYGLLLLVLCITTACSLLLSHVRMMWADELLSYWGDRLPTAADVMHVQLHYPISLDPPTYHLLAHWSMQVFGQGATGMRMPALLGVVLAQVTLYFFVRRMAGARAGVIAAALPGALGPFWYSAEGRPYGWLLGMYGLAMLCWLVAGFGGNATTGEKQVLRLHPSGPAQDDKERIVPLLGLALAIAGAITSHYFGVLVLLPLAAGELARTMERRQVDWGMVAALASGAASLGLILPFQHALKVYQEHYYNRHVTLQAIKLGYTNAISQSFAATCLLVLVVAVAGSLRFRRRERRESAAVWAMLAALALMPVWCFLFEKFVTHSMEGRYAVPAVLAFVVVMALLLGPWLRNRAGFYAVLALVLLAGVGSIAVKVRREMRFRREFMSETVLSAVAASARAANPAKPIYINSFGDFLQDQYYAPTDLQARLTYVYDAGEDVRWLGRDTHSISAVNVRNYAPLHTATYAQFLQEDKPLLLVYGVEDWEWIPRELAAQRVAVAPLGKLMLGELEQVETHLR